MLSGNNTPEKKHFTEEQIKELRNRPIDLSDIPEIEDFSGFYLRNRKQPEQKDDSSVPDKQ